MAHDLAPDRGFEVNVDLVGEPQEADLDIGYLTPCSIRPSPCWDTQEFQVDAAFTYRAYAILSFIDKP